MFKVDVSGFVVWEFWAFRGYRSRVSVLHNSDWVVPFSLFLICIIQHGSPVWRTGQAWKWLRTTYAKVKTIINISVNQSLILSLQSFFAIIMKSNCAAKDCGKATTWRLWGRVKAYFYFCVNSSFDNWISLTKKM